MAEEEKQVATVETEAVEPPKKIKEEELLVWQSPGRPFKRRSREFFTTAGAIAFLVIVILFFIKEWFLIAVVVAILFYSFIMATTPPGMVENKLTNLGVMTGESKYSWGELNRFWFSEQFGQEVLHLGMPLRLPGEVLILLGDQPKEKVRKVLEEYLEQEMPKPNLVDKASRWLTEKVVLEKEG